MELKQGSNSKSQVVHAQSYKKGIPNEKRIILPGKLPGDAGADAAKAHLHAQVKAVVNLILMDREGAIQKILTEQDKRIRGNERIVLPDPASLLAGFLADLWTEEGIDLPNVELYQGMCGYEQHAWLKAGMTARQVHEPDYFYTIDPWGRGVSVISLSGQQSDIVVLKPWSPFHIVYAGKAVRSLALAENMELVTEIIHETTE